MVPAAMLSGISYSTLNKSDIGSEIITTYHCEQRVLPVQARSGITCSSIGRATPSGFRWFESITWYPNVYHFFPAHQCSILLFGKH